MNNKFYNLHAGNHCYPKCSRDKILKCRNSIFSILQKKVKITTHKEFIELIRKKHKICDLSPVEYIRKVYSEPICHCVHRVKLNKMSNKEKLIFKTIEELTLLLIWLTRFSEQKIEGQPIWRAWKGYDFSVLDVLLDKEYVSFSYKSRSVLLRDKGIKKAKELMEKYHFKI